MGRIIDTLRANERELFNALLPFYKYLSRYEGAIEFPESLGSIESVLDAIGAELKATSEMPLDQFRLSLDMYFHIEHTAHVESELVK